MSLLDTASRIVARHEGFSATVYKDTLGFDTIGFGRLVDKRRGGGITRDEAIGLLRNDLNDRLNVLQKLSFWGALGEARQAALLDMAYQLGTDGFMAFRGMIAALAKGDFATAANEALASKWAQQTPARAADIAKIIRTGILS